MTPNKRTTSGKALFINNNLKTIQNNSQVKLAQLITSNNNDNDEPELVCRERELDPSVEDEIKDGFFELRQKFKG